MRRGTGAPSRLSLCYRSRFGLAHRCHSEAAFVRSTRRSGVCSQAKEGRPFPSQNALLRSSHRLPMCVTRQNQICPMVLLKVTLKEKWCCLAESVEGSHMHERRWGWGAWAGYRSGGRRREMDGISEANFQKCVLGLCVLDTAGWRSPDRSGRRGGAKSGCKQSAGTERRERKFCLREQKSGQ